MSATTVLGGGAWGTALAVQMTRAGHAVRLWARDAALVEELRRGANPRYLPGAALPPIAATTDLEAALSGAGTVLSVIPAQALRAVLEQAVDVLPADVPLVLCAKGIEHDTGLLLSQVAQAVLPGNTPVAALSGPSFAADVAAGKPTAVVAAASRPGLAAALARSCSTDAFRCYSTTDLTGVEVGGALKNVFAIAAGAVTGAGFGASAQAALVTRGFVELVRIGEALGARPQTLMGLSGLGDLMLTCASEKSRNFAYGVAVGRGAPRTGLPLAEGVATAGIAARIARERGIDAPILAAVAAILDGRIGIGEAVRQLMSRPLRPEADE